jgi:hypothetical protein
MSETEWNAFMLANAGGWWHLQAKSHTDASRAIPMAESQMILTHGKRAWKTYKETGIKPAALVCPVMTMVSDFFMRLKYPNAYRAPKEQGHTHGP